MGGEVAPYHGRRQQQQVEDAIVQGPRRGARPVWTPCITQVVVVPLMLLWVLCRLVLVVLHRVALVVLFRLVLVVLYRLVLLVYAYAQGVLSGMS